MKVCEKTGLFSLPSNGEQATENSIFTLMREFNISLYEHGIPPSTLVQYSRFGICKILDYHIANGSETYSKELSNALLQECHEKLLNGELKEYVWKNTRRMVAVLNKYLETGEIHLERLPQWGLRQPTAGFAQALSGFIENLELSGIVADTTIPLAKNSARGLIFVLEDSGYSSFKDVGFKELSDCMSIYASRFGGGLGKMLYCIKLFLKYLYQNGITEVDLCLALPQFIPYRKSSIEPFTDEEIFSLLEVINRSTSIGKRDFAVITIAIQTGLRCVDIVNLKLDSIDWRKNEIRLVQSKNDKALVLPLLADSGNAIADYILNGRPESSSPYIFLSNKRVPSKMLSNSMISRLELYKKKAGIDKSKRGRAFHSLRRSFATRLLDAEIPLDLLEQLLGHSDYASAKPYLSINEKNLKMCSLDFPVKEVTP